MFPGGVEVVAAGSTEEFGGAAGPDAVSGRIVGLAGDVTSSSAGICGGADSAEEE